MPQKAVVFAILNVILNRQVASIYEWLKEIAMIEEANAHRAFAERIRRIIGSLPEPGQIPDPDSYPFETVQPSSDGFVERDGVRIYYAVWGDQGPYVVWSPIYQAVHMVFECTGFRRHIP